MFSASQYPVFSSGCNQRDAPNWTPGIKANLCKTAVDSLPGNSSSRHSNKKEAPKMWRCEAALRILFLPRAPKPNRHSRALLHAILSNDMAAFDFLHHKNPSTFAGVEPSTLGAEDQRQTNQPPHPAGNETRCKSKYKDLVH
ncbi:hypothetical protein TNCV_2081631 [Trichonephila clavipes]|nr:hypothetical protein TNCV_2081631 [Trichonephila clavipes]